MGLIFHITKKKKKCQNYGGVGDLINTIHFHFIEQTETKIKKKIFSQKLAVK